MNEQKKYGKKNMQEMLRKRGMNERKEDWRKSGSKKKRKRKSSNKMKGKWTKERKRRTNWGKEEKMMNELIVVKKKNEELTRERNFKRENIYKKKERMDDCEEVWIKSRSNKKKGETK